MVENTTNHFEHKIRTLSRERSDSSKPADAHGVRYAWQVGGEKPASGAGLAENEVQPENEPCCYPQRSGQGKDSVLCNLLRK
jgi:hypothetical protein